MTKHDSKGRDKVGELISFVGATGVGERDKLLTFTELSHILGPTWLHQHYSKGSVRKLY